MLKSQSLCTGAKANLRVLGEVEKNSFIALPGKGGHSWLLPLKIVCPNPGGFDEEFYSNSSRVGLLTRLGCVQGQSLLLGSMSPEEERSRQLVEGGVSSVFLFVFNFFLIFILLFLLW